MHNYEKIILLLVAVLALGFYWQSGGYQNQSIERFAHITRTSPLIYDALLDSAGLEKQLGILEEKEEKFLKYWGIAPRIFATGHLHLLGPIKDATEAFFKNPSYGRARKLSGLQRNFALEYKKNAQTTLSKLEKLFSGREDAVIRFFGSGTTPQIIMDDLRLIIKNGNTLLVEVGEREKCLFYGECSLAPLTQTKFRSLSVDLNLVWVNRQNHQDLLSPEILVPIRFDAFRGPYAIETGCFGFDASGAPLVHPFYLFERKTNGAAAPFPKRADENYYIDLTYQNDPFAREMLRRGIRYDYQIETNDYDCTDLTVWPKIIALDYALRTGEKPSDVLWTLPYILPTIPAINYLLQNSPIEDEPPPEDWLYSVHNAYSLFYLPFSPSVWLLNEEPHYLLKTSFPLEHGQTSYSQLKARGLDDEEIAKFAFSDEAIFRDLSRNKKADSFLLPRIEDIELLNPFLFEPLR